ncbi:MAG: HEAT repeat domain-containing protein [Planctomycetes bacterium]|nr:HEAT repeat domain-containing protein [Planctomycetota bacterium]
MPRLRLPTCLLLCLCLSRPSLAAGPAQIPDVLTEDMAKFEAFMKNPVPEVRVDGVQGARFLRAFEFESQLVDLLKDDDLLVRREAVQALAECGTEKSVPLLIERLDDADWQVQEHALHALRLMTGQSSLAPKKADWEAWWKGTSLEEKQKRLLAGLASSDAETRAAAARAMRCLATPQCEDAILKLLTESKSLTGKERKFLTEALDHIGTDKSMSYFLQRAGAGDRAAAWALGRRGGKDAEEALLKGFRRNGSLDFLLNLDRVKTTKCGPFVPRLCRNFNSLIRAGRGEEMRYPRSPLQRVSANLIRRTGQAPMLIDLILAEMEGKPKEAAIPKNYKPLFECLRKVLKPEFVREGLSADGFLLGALYDLANDKAIAPRLIPLLRSKVLLVRIYAGMTLGKLQAPEAVGPIVEVIQGGYAFPDCTSPVSAKHTSAFVEVDGKRQRQSQTVRWLGYLCDALGHIGTDDARKALEAFAADPKAPRDVRYGSVVGLGHIASVQSLSALEKVSREDIIWLVRDTARRTIADIRIKNRAKGKGAENTRAN